MGISMANGLLNRGAPTGVIRAQLSIKCIPGVLALLTMLSLTTAELHGPYFVVEPPNRVDFSNNTGTTLRCSAQGEPRPRVQWTNADGSAVTNVAALRHVHDNGTMEVLAFSAEKYRQDIHATVYRCMASNIVGVTLSRNVNVRSVVTQVYEIQVYDEFVNAGNTAIFKCHIPSFVEDYVTVTSWIMDPAVNIYMTSDDAGKYRIMPTGELHIRHVARADAFAKFRCRTVHRLTGKSRTSTSTGRLYVTDPSGSVPPSIVHHKLTLRSRQGDTILLPCVAHGYPVPQCSWFIKMDDGKHLSLPTTGKYQQQTGYLKINDAQVSDSGTYVCVANNTVGSGKAETVLSIWAPLSASAQPPVLLSMVNHPASFHCVVSGSPLGPISWLKDGKPLPKDVRILASRDVLQIFAVRREDRGMYQCIMANDDDVVQGTAELRLGDLPPEFQHTFAETTLQAGSMARFQCAVSGIPVPKLSWYLDNVEVVDGNRVSTDVRTGDNADTVGSLNISNVVANDGGEYSCIANNRVGTITHSARLNIFGPLFVRQSPKKSTISGKDLVLKCPYGGHPIEAITWEKDGTRLPVDHRQVTFRNGTLLVRSVQREQDAGIYRCTVTDQQGRFALGNIEVGVLVPPMLTPFSFPEKLHVGMRVQQFCAVPDGDLPLTIDWFRDGQALDLHANDHVIVRRIDDYTSSLVLTNVDSRHDGNYTCVASNSAGSVSHSARLAINVPPKWRIVPSDKQVLAGNDVIIDCQADGSPKPMASWMKAVDNRPGEYEEVSYATVQQRMRQLSNGSLLIRAANQTEAGAYSCRVSNGIGPGLSKVVTLTVNSVASFQVRKKNVTVRSGYQAVLKCEPHGDGPIEITWYFSNRKLNVDPKPRYSITRPQNNSSILTVSHAENKDAGFYNCRARNAYGEDETLISLTVLETPAPPDMLAVLSHGSRSMTLTWMRPFDGNTPITRYIVQVADSAATGAKRELFNSTVDGSESTATVSGLTPATPYVVHMLAENTVGISEKSKTVSFTTSEEAPSGPPTGVTAEAVEAQTVKISWKPPLREHWNGNIRGYYVGFKEDDASSTYTFMTVESSENIVDRMSVLIDKLKQFTKYRVVVQTFNSVGTGPKSEEIIVVTSEGVPNRAPENVGCSPMTSQSVRLSWEPMPQPTHNGMLQGYKIGYSPVDEWYENSRMESKSTTGHQIVLTGLRKYTNYSIQVAGYTKVGDGIISEPIYCTTKEDVPDAPADLKAVVTSETSILVAWKKPTNPNGFLKRYNVYMRRGDQQKLEEVSKHPVTATQTHFEAHNLRANSVYELWVTAVTSIGEGQSTRVVTQSTAGPVVPASIVSFGNKLVVPWSSSVELACKAVGSPMPATEWTFEGRSLVSSADRMTVAINGSLLIPQAKGEDTGSYQCKAFNGYGSDEIIYVLHVQVPPKSPSLTVPSVSLFSLDLRWTVGNDGGSPIDGYYIYYKRDFGEWEEVPVGPKHQMYTLEGLECGTRYQIYLTASNRHGVSLPSETISTKTKGSPPQAPPKSAFIRESTTSVTLQMESWESGGCPILYFVVQYKSTTSSDWRLVSNNVLAQQKEFMIPDLTPSAWYNLKVTAHNNAGSTVQQYQVATFSIAGGTMSPKLARDGPADNLPFFYDIKLIAIIVSILIALITIILVTYLSCRRRYRTVQRHTAPSTVTIPSTRQDFGKNSSAGSFTYLLGGNKKPPNTQAQNYQKKAVTGDINPYATSKILNSQMREMQTFGERSVSQVYPTLRREMGEGTFPRSRRESEIHVEQPTRINSIPYIADEYTCPVDEADDEDPDQRTQISPYPIYASYTRVSKMSPSQLNKIDHNVPDLLEHGPESSTSNDTSSEVVSNGHRTPGSIERRYIGLLDSRRGPSVGKYGNQETTFVFSYHREPHEGELVGGSQEFSETECDREENPQYRPEADLKELYSNNSPTSMYHRLRCNLYPVPV